MYNDGHCTQAMSNWTCHDGMTFTYSDVSIDVRLHRTECNLPQGVCNRVKGVMITSHSMDVH